MVAQQPHHVPEPVAAPPVAAKPPPTPKEPTINERASGLLAAMTDAQRHNAPITPWMLSELAAVVGKVTGDKAVVPGHNIMDSHGLPTELTFSRAQDTHLTMVSTAEVALAYLRGLPADVQARAHWVAADKVLVEACESVANSDVSPAIRLFKLAVAEDRRLDPKPAPKIADKPDAPKPQHA